MRFNSEKYESFYNRIKNEAMKSYGFTEEEVARCNLSKLHKETKSTRILRMINLAYHLGMMRGIKDCDEVFHSKISMRNKLMVVNQPTTTKEDLQVANFHRSRLMFAILPNGSLVYIRDEVRGHKDWLKSDYDISNYEFSAITRGYALDGNIVFYKGEDFKCDFYVVQDAHKYGKEIAKLYGMTKANVYTGVIVGEIGELWSPDKFLYTINLDNKK